jgi:hypothetical protein
MQMGSFSVRDGGDLYLADVAAQLRTGKRTNAKTPVELAPWEILIFIVMVLSAHGCTRQSGQFVLY